MSSIPSFSKIFQVGSEYVPNLFNDPVEVTEKVDGSQFAFGKAEDGRIVLRSKGKEMFFEQYDKMFLKAVEYVKSNSTALENLLLLKPSTFFYTEFLRAPKHNVLSYERVPTNSLVLFGMINNGKQVKEYEELRYWALNLKIDVVPLLYKGRINSVEELNKFLDTDSYLGKEKVEGIVIKNYYSPALVGNQIFPSFAKYVRPQFKERHGRDWKRDHSKKGKLETFLESFRSEARWHKAVQHLEEQGKLLHEPKDIGSLMKEIATDLLSEETENIKQELFDLYKHVILHKAQHGFPEWYKEQLAKKVFEKKENV